MKSKLENIKERKTKKGSFYYEVQVYDKVNEKLISKTFNEKKYGSKSRALEFAKRYRDEVKAKLLNINVMSNYSVDNTLSVKDIFNLMLKFDPCVLSTRKKVVSTFNKYIFPYFDETVRFSDIKMLDIQRNLNLISDIASTDTITRVLSIWRKMYNIAISMDIVIKNEVTGVKKPQSNYVIKLRNKTTNTKEVEEVSKSILMGMENKREAQLIVNAMKILYYEPIRPQEVFALSKKCINIKDGIISIIESVGSSASELNVIKNPKTI